jgi:hypothetical protein
MDAIGRVVVLGVVVTLSVVLGVGLVHVSAQASNPRLATWKLNRGYLALTLPGLLCPGVQEFTALSP